MAFAEHCCIVATVGRNGRRKWPATAVLPPLEHASETKITVETGPNARVGGRHGLRKNDADVMTSAPIPTNLS
jgi:hypothetical protein